MSRGSSSRLGKERTCERLRPEGSCAGDRGTEGSRHGCRLPDRPPRLRTLPRPHRDEVPARLPSDVARRGPLARAISDRYIDDHAPGLHRCGRRHHECARADCSTPKAGCLRRRAGRSRCGARRATSPSNPPTTSGRPAPARCAKRCREAQLPPAFVKGIGFDATSSLVVLDRAGKPLSVSLSGDPQRNIIVWMDHRAIAQARRITGTVIRCCAMSGVSSHPRCKPRSCCGSRRCCRRRIARPAHFLDLADYLSLSRDRKHGALAVHRDVQVDLSRHERRWSPRYFERIDLADLLANDGERIGRELVEPGSALGGGLTPEAALALGLLPGTPVGASLIDAHAGGIGTIGGQGADGGPVDVLDRLAYVMGTSACIMATTATPCFVARRVGAVFLGDGSGAVAERRRPVGNGSGDRPSPAVASGLSRARRRCDTSPAWRRSSCSERGVIERPAALGEAAFLAARPAMCLPSSSAIGRRLPIPKHGPSIAGLDLDEGPRKPAAAVRGGAVRDRLRARRCRRRDARAGHPCRTIVVSGGASRSALVRQVMADATGISVVLPATGSRWCSVPQWWERSRPARSRRFARP